MSWKTRIGGVAAIVVIAGLSWQWRASRDPLVILLKAAPRDARFLEARLTGGFPWAPLQSRRRSGESTALADSPRIFEAGALVMQVTAGQSSPRSLRSRAIARLLCGSVREATSELGGIARSLETDPDAWSDYGAAQSELAVIENDGAMLAHALASLDKALRLDPDLSEALFNRALVLERLGTRDAARKAWERFLASEPGSDWAVEARARFPSLLPAVPFRDVLDTRYDELASRPEAAHALARAEPLNARRYGETKILGQWAEAEQAGDHDLAGRHLRVAREFGAELQRHRGEGMLEGAVVAIDRAAIAQRRHLVRGHILFRDGQRAFMADDAAAAQKTLVRAAEELGQGGSPLTLVAEYFVAHTYHALGDLSEARRREEELLARAPEGFPSHRAHLLWHLGLGFMSDARWGEALRAFRESAAIFERIEETEFATTVHGLIAEVYDRTGDPVKAWSHRIIALRQIGSSSTARLQMSLDSVARAAIARKEWPVAISFLDLASDVAAKIDDPMITVEMRSLQAIALARAGSPGAATGAIAQARSAAARLRDDAARESASAEIIATEALVVEDPGEAVRLLTAAIEYHRTRGRKLRLPDMLLSRARAWISLHDDEEAAVDLEQGIVLLEASRQTLPAGEERWGIFHAADELFEEAVALALKAGDRHLAFRYAERARSRELLESIGASPADVLPASIASDTALVEYFPLTGRLVTFVVTRDGIEVVVRAEKRETLEEEIAAFGDALMNERSEADSLGRNLHRRLIEPLDHLLIGKTRIIFVAGSVMDSVPFAALRDDSGRFLVERFRRGHRTERIGVRMARSRHAQREAPPVARPCQSVGAGPCPAPGGGAGSVGDWGVVR